MKKREIECVTEEKCFLFPHDRKSAREKMGQRGKEKCKKVKMDKKKDIRREGGER